MTTAEKIALAKSNNYFTLFKEGLFYKCYNEDAMVFVQRLRAYKVSTKFIKIVGDTVYSIGFPVGEVEKGSLTLEFISEKIAAKSFEIKETDVLFLHNDGDLKNDYKDWIDTIQEQEIIKGSRESSALYKPPIHTTTIISMIKNYDIANSTPTKSVQ